MPTNQEMKKATKTVDAMLGTVTSKPTGAAKHDTPDGINQRKRTLSTSPSSLPHSTASLPNMAENNQINDNSAPNKQNMEMIAQKETLHHIEMAWRAQQRLVRRCLGLRLFGEKSSKSQSEDTNNDTDNIKEGK